MHARMAMLTETVADYTQSTTENMSQLTAQMQSLMSAASQQ